MIDGSGDEPGVREGEGRVVVGFVGGPAAVRENHQRQVVAGNRRANRDGLWVKTPKLCSVAGAAVGYQIPKFRPAMVAPYRWRLGSSQNQH